MSKINYFAYGSNMSSKRLRARLSSSSPHGVGVLHGYRLEFHKPSMKDGSGKCGVIRSVTRRVHGVLFHIDADQKPTLDACEGVGHGYVEKMVEIAMANGHAVTALTYCPTVNDPFLPPFTWYKRHVLEGAREFALPDHYINRIERVDAINDPDGEREARELAIYAGASGRQQHG